MHRYHIVIDSLLNDYVEKIFAKEKMVIRLKFDMIILFIILQTCKNFFIKIQNYNNYNISNNVTIYQIRKCNNNF